MKRGSSRPGRAPAPGRPGTGGAGAPPSPSWNGTGCSEPGGGARMTASWCAPTAMAAPAPSNQSGIPCSRSVVERVERRGRTLFLQQELEAAKAEAQREAQRAAQELEAAKARAALDLEVAKARARLEIARLAAAAALRKAEAAGDDTRDGMAIWAAAAVWGAGGGLRAPPCLACRLTSRSCRYGSETGRPLKACTQCQQCSSVLSGTGFPISSGITGWTERAVTVLPSSRP
eukprot:tig00000492_g1393.t1